MSIASRLGFPLTRNGLPVASRRHSRRRSEVLLPRDLCVEPLEDRALLAGALDPSYGTGGISMAPVTAGNDFPSTLMLQRDGKAVVVGTVPGVTGDLTTSSSFAVTRFNTDGSLDGTFGNGGTSIISVSTFSNAFGMAIQGDGRIIVVGEASPGGRIDFALARLNVDGSLDGSFGNGGLASTIVGQGNSRAASVAMQANGQIVVGGTAFNGTRNDFAMARYNANGLLDTNFGNGGALMTGIGGVSNFGIVVRMQIDQRIMLAGNTSNDGTTFSTAVLRYLPNGSLDTSWNGTGVAVATLGSSTTTSFMSVQADNRVVVASTAFVAGVNNFAVLRYLSNGTLDTSFGGGRGFVTTAFGASPATAFGMAILPNAQIVVAGEVVTNGLEQFGVVRYNVNGSLDVSFGTGGRVIGSAGTGNSGATGIRVQSDGNYVLTGPAENVGSGVDFAALRLTGTDVVPQPPQDAFTELRVYRAYNAFTDDHFFTTSLAEFNAAVAGGYTDETTGRGGFAVYAGQVIGSSPLFRLLNPNDGRHYYTISAGERDSLARVGWRYEKIEGYMFNTLQPGTTEIFHVYNVLSGSRVFTETPGVRDAILTQFPGIWVEQRSLGFAFPVDASSPITSPQTLAGITSADLTDSLAPALALSTPAVSAPAVSSSLTIAIAADTTSTTGTGTPTSDSTGNGTPPWNSPNPSSTDEEDEASGSDPLGEVFATLGWDD